MKPAETPIQLEFTKAVGKGTAQLTTFDSYSFDRSIMVPASPFRFTAPGVDKATRTAIRSGDMVTLLAVNGDGSTTPLGTGFIDETDTHVTANRVEYVLSGRDTLGQLVDNAAVDGANKIFNVSNFTLKNILTQLLKNTRMPQQFISQQVPNGAKLFNTNPGETKINALQRYLELTNCLVWTNPLGQVIMGKPDFTQARQGQLVASSSDPSQNNVIEARARRNVNMAIRKIVTQLQTLEQVDASSYTKLNNDPDMVALQGSGVGRSVYNVFSYAQGTDRVNQITSVGSQSGNDRSIGADYSLREIAKDNMKILEVDLMARGHLNDNGVPFNIDQIYTVVIEDDDVNEDMIVHHCSYQLTAEHGLMTSLQLVRLGTIVAGGNAVRSST